MGKNKGKTTSILLLRHAHAAWARPGMRDFDRPLDARGVEDACLIGEAMRAEDLVPKAVLCSPARRCVETSDIVTGYFATDFRTDYIDDLYSRGHNRYIELLSEQDGGVVLLVGHNPMMEDTARTLTGSAESWPGERLEKGFPTAGLAVIDFDPSADLRMGGHLGQFLTPKRLRKLQRSAS